MTKKLTVIHETQRKLKLTISLIGLSEEELAPYTKGAKCSVGTFDL